MASAPLPPSADSHANIVASYLTSLARKTDESVCERLSEIIRNRVPSHSSDTVASLPLVHPVSWWKGKSPLIETVKSTAARKTAEEADRLQANAGSLTDEGSQVIEVALTLLRSDNVKEKTQAMEVLAIAAHLHAVQCLVENNRLLTLEGSEKISKARGTLKLFTSDISAQVDLIVFLDNLSKLTQRKLSGKELMPGLDPASRLAIVDRSDGAKREMMQYLDLVLRSLQASSRDIEGILEPYSPKQRLEMCMHLLYLSNVHVDQREKFTETDNTRLIAQYVQLANFLFHSIEHLSKAGNASDFARLATFANSPLKEAAFPGKGIEHAALHLTQYLQAAYLMTELLAGDLDLEKKELKVGQVYRERFEFRGHGKDLPLRFFHDKVTDSLVVVSTVQPSILDPLSITSAQANPGRVTTLPSIREEANTLTSAINEFRNRNTKYARLPLVLHGVGPTASALQDAAHANLASRETPVTVLSLGPYKWLSEASSFGHKEGLLYLDVLSPADNTGDQSTLTSQLIARGILPSSKHTTTFGIALQTYYELSGLFGILNHSRSTYVANLERDLRILGTAASIQNFINIACKPGVTFDELHKAFAEIFIAPNGRPVTLDSIDTGRLSRTSAQDGSRTEKKSQQIRELNCRLEDAKSLPEVFSQIDTQYLTNMFNEFERDLASNSLNSAVSDQLKHFFNSLRNLEPEDIKWETPSDTSARGYLGLVLGGRPHLQALIAPELKDKEGFELAFEQARLAASFGYGFAPTDSGANGAMFVHSFEGAKIGVFKPIHPVRNVINAAIQGAKYIVGQAAYLPEEKGAAQLSEEISYQEDKALGFGVTPAARMMKNLDALTQTRIKATGGGVFIEYIKGIPLNKVELKAWQDAEATSFQIAAMMSYLRADLDSKAENCLVTGNYPHRTFVLIDAGNCHPVGPMTYAYKWVDSDMSIYPFTEEAKRFASQLKPENLQEVLNRPQYSTFFTPQMKARELARLNVLMEGVGKGKLENLAALAQVRSDKEVAQFPNHERDDDIL